MEHYCTGMPDSKSRDPEKLKIFYGYSKIKHLCAIIYLQ